MPEAGMPVAGARGRRWAGLRPYLYLAPVILLLGLFTYWPLLDTLYLSLTRWNLNPGVPIRFVGVANYERLVASSLFADAARNTLYYVLASVPLKVLLPLPFAIAVWALPRAGRIYRSILFLPTLISFVAISVVFLWLLNPIGGLLSRLLFDLGLVSARGILADGAGAFWTIMAISSWKVLGFNVLLYLAGLSRISDDLIAAMRLDGASDWQVVRHLVWPLLMPTTFFVLVTTTIFAIQQVFTPIDVLTQGGPFNSTTNLFYMVYQLTFRTFDVGRGAAATVLIFLLLLGITLFKFGVLDRRVQYDQ